MKEKFKKIGKQWIQKDFLKSVVLGFILLAISIWFSIGAVHYTNREASNSVTDIILDNLPVIDVSLVFIDGTILFLFLLIALLLCYPRYIPFSLKAIALFLVIRAIFVSLTHMAPPLVHSTLVFDGTLDRILRPLLSGDDLFFSGHTGLPFLMALIFQDKKSLRLFFLISSAIAGASVLLGHLHYSIDVFAAFFITYCIYLIAQEIFGKDYKMIAAPLF